VDVEGCGRLSVHDGLLDVPGFLCASWVICWRGMKVSWVVAVGESASALGDRRVCMSIRMFEDDIA
jgi:hypothetical protein